MSHIVAWAKISLVLSRGNNTRSRTCVVMINAVRVKGRMSLRNGMWHGLRNDIIMQNLIYAAE